MPRHDRANNKHVTTKQKGAKRRGGVGSYSRKGKAKRADRYDRPYLSGNYNREMT